MGTECQFKILESFGIFLRFSPNVSLISIPLETDSKHASSSQANHLYLIFLPFSLIGHLGRPL